MNGEPQIGSFNQPGGYTIGAVYQSKGDFVTNSEKIHFKGRFLGMIERDRWEYAFRTNASGVVAMVPVTDAGELVLVEQHRTPVSNRVLELPAGLVGDTGDRDENFKLAANRELEEETGYRATRLEELLVGPSSAGMCDEILTIYYADGLEKVGPGGGDGNEDITVYLVPLDSAGAWLREKSDKGILIDPKVYAGMYWAGMRYR